MRKGFFQNNILTKKSLTGFFLFVLVFFNGVAQTNLIYNGDFTGRTDVFYSMDGGDVHRNLVGWDEVNTPDHWGKDTVDGRSDFVFMILESPIEMITNRLKENLVGGCEYEFTFLAYTKNTKKIPVTLLFPNDTDAFQNQVDVYRLTKIRQIVRVKRDKLSDKRKGYHWRLYSAKFIAKAPHSRIIIGNTLHEISNIFGTRIAELKLYSIKQCSPYLDKTIQFK